MRRHALKEKMENEPYRLRLFGINHDLACLFILVQTEEATVGEADLPIRHALALPPSDVFGNGSALFLRKARHDGDEQLPIERLFDTITFCTLKGQFCTLQGALLIDSGCIVCAYEKERLLRHLEETHN